MCFIAGSSFNWREIAFSLTIPCNRTGGEAVREDNVSERATMFCGAVVGLAVSSAVLLLMGFGVSGVLHAGYGIDLMYVLWPSSLMLVTGWRTTPTGILITVNSVALNCAMYAALALALRFAIRLCVRQLKRATR